MATIDLIKNSSFETKLGALVTAINNVKPADGFSPVVVATKTGNKTTITVTNKDGAPTSVDILDGGSVNYASSEPSTVVNGDTWVSSAK